MVLHHSVRYWIRVNVTKPFEPKNLFPFPWNVPRLWYVLPEHILQDLNSAASYLPVGIIVLFQCNQSYSVQRHVVKVQGCFSGIPHLLDEVFTKFRPRWELQYVQPVNYSILQVVTEFRSHQENGRSSNQRPGILIVVTKCFQNQQILFRIFSVITFQMYIFILCENKKKIFIVGKMLHSISTDRFRQQFVIIYFAA